MNHPDSSSAESPLSDEHLAKLLHSELLFDERVSSQDISVQVNDGIATLRGAVPSFRRKLAAQQIASSFEGVRDVINQLLVEPTDRPDDGQVSKNVCAALDASEDLTAATIDAAINNGKATLTGHVSNAWERLIAEDVVRGVRGVREVINLLVVDQERHIDDHELRNSLQAALTRARGLKTADIQATIADGTVVLNGYVDELWHKEIAETVVGRFGFLRLRNELQVRK